MATTIKFKKATAADWTSNNPVLASGEPGIETDTSKMKIGNGTQAWDVLTYVNEAPYSVSFSPTIIRTYGANDSDTQSSLGREFLGLHTNSAVVGERSNTGTDDRKLKVYSHSSGALERTISNPNTSTYHNFAQGKAMHGKYLSVGALDPWVYTTAYMHIYDITTGSLVDTISKSISSQDQSGGSNTSLFFNQSMSSNYLIGGNPGAQVSGTANTGNIYIYKSTLGDWTDTSYVTSVNNPTSSYGQFGYASAISGDVACVGAPQTAHNGVNSSGTAYLIDLTNGSVIHSFASPVPSLYATYGKSMAFISSNLVAIGEVGSDVDASNAGNVYIYKTTDGTWTDTALLDTISSPAGANGGFGGTIVSSDGYLCVAAAEHSGGTVYVYSSSNGNWDDAAVIYTASNSIDSTYQGDVSIDINSEKLILGREANNSSAYPKGYAELYELFN